MTKPEKPEGLRERQRRERRAHLVRVTRALLEDDATAQFTMPELARHAGVSLATPYNLFGSKAQILQAVFERDVAGLHRKVAGQDQSDPLGALIASLADLAATLSQRRGYYQALSRSLSELGQSETGRLIRPLSRSLLAPSMRAIDEAGLLRPLLPLSALTVLVTRQYEAVFRQWTLEDWQADRLVAELLMAIGGTLLGFLEPDARNRLEVRLSKLNHLPNDQFPYNAL